VAERLPPELRADLTDFARVRIEQVWADVGAVPAQVLAENIVAAHRKCNRDKSDTIPMPAGITYITERNW
jgi:hypothetical protein